MKCEVCGYEVELRTFDGGFVAQSEAIGWTVLLSGEQFCSIECFGIWPGPKCQACGGTGVTLSKGAWPIPILSCPECEGKGFVVEEEATPEEEHYFVDLGMY